jgi:hypothetical protein
MAAGRGDETGFVMDADQPRRLREHGPTTGSCQSDGHTTRCTVIWSSGGQRVSLGLHVARRQPSLWRLPAAFSVAREHVNDSSANLGALSAVVCIVNDDWTHNVELHRKIPQ